MEASYYKKLFEVRILHEYYLSKDNVAPYFSLTTPERTSLLDNRLFHNQYDILRDLEVVPTDECKKLLQNYHIKLVPRKTGFFAGVRVMPQGADFIPYIPQLQGLSLTFILQVRNPYFQNITGLKLRPVLPALPYFTNDNPDNTKTYPSLSEPVAVFKANTHYEMGELAQMGNKLKEAIVSTTTNQNSNWREITSNNLVNESDRLLLPTQFRYTFDRNKNIKQATFALKQNGITIKTIALSGTERLNSVLLDFETNGATPPLQTASGFYQLEVSGENGYTDKRKIYVNNALYDTRNFGVIVLHITSSASHFGIFTPAGSLKVPHPVFEVRLKSRISYWRYKSDQGKTFILTPKTSPYLSEENGALRSILPLHMISNPVEFRDANPAIPRVFLPNPPDNSLRTETNGLFYSDIYLSQIKDLIAEA